MRSKLPGTTFLTVHYAYFILTSLISAVIFWSAATPFRSVSFTDSLFLTVSAMTLAGLNTINLSTLNTVQQAILFLLIMLGSAIFVSSFVVHIRRKAFDQRFRSQIEEEQRSRTRSAWFPSTLSRSMTSRSRSRVRSDLPVKSVDADQISDGMAVGRNSKDSVRNEERDQSEKERVKPGGDSSSLQPGPATAPTSPLPSPRSPSEAQDDHVTFSNTTVFRETQDSGIVRRIFSMNGVGARNDGGSARLTMQSSRLPSQDSPGTRDEARSDAFPSSSFITRNSNFHNLTQEDRLRLGGTEYKAVSLLAWIVPTYFVAWQLLGCLSLGAYVSNYYASTARENGLNPW